MEEVIVGIIIGISFFVVSVFGHTIIVIGEDKKDLFFGYIKYYIVQIIIDVF